MKRLLICFSLCLVSGFMALDCHRRSGVQAGSEAGAVRNRDRSPAGNHDPGGAGGGANRAIACELMRVDMAGKTFSTRVNNGMVQTFKFDDRTSVEGLAAGKIPQPAGAAKPSTPSTPPMYALLGKEGSELSVQWRDDAGAKSATRVNVIEVSTSRRMTPSPKTNRPKATPN